MELIFAIIFIGIAIISENTKRRKKDVQQMKSILEQNAKQQSQGRVNTSSAFEQARQRATQTQRAQQRVQNEAAAGRPDPGRVNAGSAFSQVRRQGTKAVFPKQDPGRVSAQSAAQTKRKAEQLRREREKAARESNPFQPMTQREKFERNSAYEHSNRMDVRYTSNGCGCSTGKGSTSSGKAHGFSSATYDEEKFFRESREICSGNWS